MTARLATGIWVAAYLARLRQAGLAAYVVARGDPTAGSVVVKVVTAPAAPVRAFRRSYDLATGTRPWQVLAEGAEPEIDALLQRERGRDPDLWLIDVEDPLGRGLLDSDGLVGD